MSRLLRFWSGSWAGWQEVRERLGWVAVLSEDPPNDNVNWHPSNSPWTGDFHPGQFQCVLLNTQLWCYLADKQLKTTESYSLRQWGSPSAGRAPEQSSLLYAARGARAL